MSVERPAHCTDSELLAYLDGELNWWRRLRVRRHLQACWRCRSRARSQEDQILNLAKTIEACDYPDALWHLDQQLELGLRLRHFENAGEAGRPKPARARLRRLVMGVAVATVVTLAVCTALVVLPRNTNRGGSDLPVKTVAGAQTFERNLYHLPTEQTLAVRIEPIHPARQAAAGQLEIWSDAAQGRFASRWTAADGTLKQALWQPGPGREYLLRPRVSHAVLQRTGHSPSDHVTDFLGPEVSGDLEGAFMRWMESRSWAPVSFAPEAAQWMSGAGARALAESITASDGSQHIRLTVERRMHAARARLTAEFDAVTFQPRSMSIRFEADGRSAELNIIAQRVRSVAAAEVAAAAVSPESVEVPTVRAPVTPPAPDRHPVFSVGPDLIDSAERAAEAQFLLHAADGCLGEPVVVEEVPGGVRVRSVQGIVGRWPEATSSSAKFADVVGALAELRDRLHGGREVENQAIPRKAVANARALRALSQQFPPRLSAALPERSRHLLQLMLQDHIEGVRAGFVDLPPGRDGKASIETIGWREAAERLYQTLANTGDETAGALPQRVARLLQALSEGFAAENRQAAEHTEIPQGAKRQFR
jgi:hypothetical protein